MVRSEFFEETSGHSEAPIRAELIPDPNVNPEAANEFFKVVNSVENETGLNEDSIRTLGEAVVTFSGTVRPQTETEG